MTLVHAALSTLGESDIDQRWCVFDVEWPGNNPQQHHPRLTDAIALAEKRGIRCAVSNPCFDLWLILHFRGYTAFFDNDEAKREGRALEGRRGSRLDPAQYFDKVGTAVARAKELARRHEGVNVIPEDNPSSGMYQLLEAIADHGAADGRVGPLNQR
jgi:hypothetical protein